MYRHLSPVGPIDCQVMGWGMWQAKGRYNRVLYVISPLAMLMLWELAVRIGALDHRFFPPPSAIVGVLVETALAGEIFRAAGTSLVRIVAGFIAGAIPGLVLGLAIGVIPLLRSALEPIIYAICPIPKLALLPLIMLLFGLGETSKIVTIALGVFFPVLINTAAGVVGIERIYIDVARSFGARGLDFYLTVALPGALPSVLTGIRLGAGLALLLIVAAEMIAAREGIGYMIWSSYQTFTLEKMYLAFLVMSVLGWLMSVGLGRLEKVLVPWKPGGGGR